MTVLIENGVKNILTPLQISVLNGTMLGDGNLNIPKGGKHPRLLIQRKLEDQEYLQWEFDLFKEFCGKSPKIKHIYDKRTNKTYHSIYFYTKHLDIFDEFHQKWYAGKKIVPKDLILDIYTILIWFMDDGCVVCNNKGRLDLQLSTDGFIKQDVEFLADLLCKRYDAAFILNKCDEKYRIIAADAATRKFLQEIDTVFPKFMKRKSDKWRLITDIYDKNIKLYKSRKMEPVIDMVKFNQLLKDNISSTFSVRDFLKKTNSFMLSDDSKYHAFYINNRFRKLIKEGKISIVDIGSNNIKILKITDIGKLYLDNLRNN